MGFLEENERVSYFINAVDTCLAAAELLMHYRGKGVIAQSKADRTPVTEADLASHQLIKQELSRYYPWPVLSEEDPVSYDERRNWKKFWLVDPLDGTKDFIRDSKEFCINLALIENGCPVFSVIYGPAVGTLYMAIKGAGSWRKNSEDWHQLNCKAEQSAKFAISRFYHSDRVAEVISSFENSDTIVCGSALKFGLIAEGIATIYPRFGLTSEWDTAAGQLIVEEAGGVVLSLCDGMPLRYNKESLFNPDFAAGVREHVDLVIGLM